uniref:Uncharacterized protein n=1 Tax=Oryza sativa subsp. japonica TaxID=39947 RepID=Q6Z3M1_ORYSJ|nr:hypothetical protein [Oryza sativa Japonica Group]BAD05575.1 hypothetical protein [Oryza sativa Japonica Group]
MYVVMCEEKEREASRLKGTWKSVPLIAWLTGKPPIVALSLLPYSPQCLHTPIIAMIGGGNELRVAAASFPCSVGDQTWGRQEGRPGRPEAAAAPVEELAKSLQGVEVFDLRGKAVPVVDLWKDMNFLSCFGRLIVYETIDAGCLQLRSAAANGCEEEKNEQGVGIS